MKTRQEEVKRFYDKFGWQYGPTLRYKLDETCAFVCGYLSKSPSRFPPRLNMDKGTALATLVLTAYAAATQLGINLDEEIDAELAAWERR